ncbi:hypothetical protein GB931_14075 [Modestobacter sp. I12A-02628]|uniref:Uncharacterized protein n=1 Tax=Goekera deserti TaxID=2497753 RepID=A0A7K3WK32_9ACTN|nr:hypothetical protein [Goekera deserti]MPQ99029.1 hypothetical protein [Goekera deserti]NDI47363.1 hypothetical protein [Goekera deserti]NEL55893.1 hypothetical protein [Goekera deserti]
MDVSALRSAPAAPSRTAGAPLPRPAGTVAGSGTERTNRAVAELLGMDSRAMNAALAGGRTVGELAAAAGVSQTDLVATIAATLPTAGAAAGTTAAAPTTVTRAGVRTATPAGLGEGVAGLSSALGISSSALMSRLRDGTGIADLLRDKPDLASALALRRNRGVMVDSWI